MLRHTRKPCHFCARYLPRDKIKKHEELCGSRTDICDKCDKHVLIRDRDQHAMSCDRDNPGLPCEICELLVPADRLTSHQQQCLIERGRASVVAEKTNGRFEKSIPKSRNSRGDKKTQREARDLKVEESKVVNESEPDEKNRPQESKVNDQRILALPCEVCSELCPSDKLMEHQRECAQEREEESSTPPGEDPRAHHRTKESATAERHESLNDPHVRYVEIRRSYSPTIEFDDDYFIGRSRFSGNTNAEDFFDRYQRVTSHSSSLGELFPSAELLNEHSGIPDVRFIEIESGYSPSIEFGEEYFPEGFTRNIPEFSDVNPNHSRRFESRHSSRSIFHEQTTRKY